MKTGIMIMVFGSLLLILPVAVPWGLGYKDLYETNQQLLSALAEKDTQLQALYDEQETGRLQAFFVGLEACR